MLAETIAARLLGDALSQLGFTKNGVGTVERLEGVVKQIEESAQLIRALSAGLKGAKSAATVPEVGVLENYIGREALIILSALVTLSKEKPPETPISSNDILKMANISGADYSVVMRATTQLCKLGVVWTPKSDGSELILNSDGRELFFVGGVLHAQLTSEEKKLSK